MPISHNTHATPSKGWIKNGMMLNNATKTRLAVMPKHPIRIPLTFKTVSLISFSFTYIIHLVPLMSRVLSF